MQTVTCGVRVCGQVRTRRIASKTDDLAYDVGMQIWLPVRVRASHTELSNAFDGGGSGS